jgi:hypothetical protein
MTALQIAPILFMPLNYWLLGKCFKHSPVAIAYIRFWMVAGCAAYILMLVTG